MISKKRKTFNNENKECLKSCIIVVKMVAHHNKGSYLIGWYKQQRKEVNSLADYHNRDAFISDMQRIKVHATAHEA